MTIESDFLVNGSTNNKENVKHTPEELVSSVTGWADYADTQYTSGSPFAVSANTDTLVPNNAGTVVDSQKPSDVTSFYSGGLITGRNGDGLLITVDMIATPTSGATTLVEIWFDITGGTGTPANLANLYRRLISFPKGNGVDRPINFTVAGYTLNTWEANGAALYIRGNGTFTLHSARYVLTRTHKAV